MVAMGIFYFSFLQFQGSPILLKSGVPPEKAMSTLRLSVGRFTKTDEIEQAIEIITAGYRKIQPSE